MLDQTPQIVRTEKITDVLLFDCQHQPVPHHLCSEGFLDIHPVTDSIARMEPSCIENLVSRDKRNIMYFDSIIVT